jgi:soluble lytic murein transglycosylase
LPIDLHLPKVKVIKTEFAIISIRLGLLTLEMMKHITITLSFLLLFLLVGSGYANAEVVRLSQSDIKIAKDAFLKAKKKKWKQAVNKAAQAKSPIPSKLVQWMRIVDPHKDVPFGDIAAFISHNSDWPRQSVLQRRAEEAMTATMAPQKVIEWFNGRQPRSANGHIRLAHALVQLGRDEETKLQVQKSWREVNFGRDQAKQFYRHFKKYLRYDDHVARMDRLLWEGRYYPARRMLPFMKKDWKALAEARLALRKMRGGVDGAIARVPAKFKQHPGLLFERMRWRRIKGRDEGARELLFQAGEVVPYPHVWWPQREVMARRAIRMGYYSEAYRIVENHGLESGAKFASAEWLAGWIKLRFLDEPDEALKHFTKLEQAVSYPISKSRAAYWLARSFERKDEKEKAKDWYVKAADFPTTYYGQLASERINLNKAITINLKAQPNSQERKMFNESELLTVVDFLKRINERDHMRSFIYQLNAMSTTAGWRTLVAELALDSGRADLAVYIGKKALQEGHGVIEQAYPLLSEELMRKTPERALVHGVVRQESAFYEKAISRAGARGLMQLMPRTASKLAKQKNYRYSRQKLTSHPKLNVWLGSEYLDDLLKKFDGSYILTLASYNAGPYRARQWINENGDPRIDDRDYIVDWVELIPFNETRNYVQRVLENIQVYRYRLKKTEMATSLETDLQRRK